MDWIADPPSECGQRVLDTVRWTPCARPLRRSIRCGKTTGFGRFSFQRIQINAAWRELSLAAIDLIVWIQALLPDGESATA